ncbi:MAG: ROK family protein [Clostridia bacterium]|nr:ROK family protein [Clostridia bacterium]
MSRRVGVDLGGTTAKLGLVNEQNEIEKRLVIPTDRTLPFEEIIARLADGIKSLGPVESVGFGVPSCLKPGSGIIIYANNFGWKNKDLRGELQKHLKDTAVYIANDADCAAVGEYFHGAGRGYESMLMLTLGTGVGGSFMFGGRLFLGGNGSGIEPGHIIVREGGEECTCGLRGCLEAYCSATALIREITSSASPLLARLIRENGGKANARILFDAVEAGDEDAQNILDRYLRTLAAGIGSLVTVMRPHIIVIGGGISQAGDRLFKPLSALMPSAVFSYDVIGCADIVPAALGNDAGIIGAACLKDALGA